MKKAPTSTFDDLVLYKSALFTLNNLPKSIPTITAITPPANGTYSTGQTLSFTVTFSSAVTVSTAGGTPYLSLSAITGSVGTGNLAKATYQSGSGTATLIFSYTVVSTDSAPTGLTMTSSITLAGGTIQSGNACAMLGFTAPNLTQVIIGTQYIYVADCSSSRLQKFNASGTWQAAVGGTSTACSNCLCTGASCPTNAGSGNGQMSCPANLATDSSGNIYAAEQNNSRVTEYSSNGVWIRDFGSSGSGNGQLNYAEGVAVDASGNVYVADQNNNRVVEFDSSGSFVKNISSSGSGNGQVSGPEDVAFDSGGNLWVVDQANSRLVQFNSSGTWVKNVGSFGTGNGQLKTPCSMTFDGSGNIWVSDQGNHRVEEFNSSGSYVQTFGSSGTGNGQFKNPCGIGVDTNGNIWQADYTNNNVQEFNSSGTWLQTFGTTGTANGKFELSDGLVISR